MAGTDRMIDPGTGDYVDDGAGAWATTTTLATAVIHQVLDEIDRWAGDPLAGSDFHRFYRARNSEIEARRAAESIRRALKPLVDAGFARSVVVSVAREGASRWRLEGSLVDIEHGELDITPLLPFGG